jgi:DUF4097 and DUF4098 domain-containing protein YvlB
MALACGLMLQPLVAVARTNGGQDGQGSVAINNTQGRVSVKLDRGSKVAISNRYGRITITGWDRDTVEATATNDKGAAEAIQVDLTADPQSRSVLTLAVVGRGGRRVLVPGMDFDFDFTPGVGYGVGTGIGSGGGVAIARRAQEAQAEKARTDKEKEKEKEKEKTKTPEARERTREEIREAIRDGAESGVIVVPMPEVVVTPNVVVTPAPGQVPHPAPAPRAPQQTQPTQPRVYVPGTAVAASEINLDVKVPRYAELSGIEVRSGDLTISNVDGPVVVASGGSNVTVNHVGALEVRSRSGNVTAEDVTGLAYIVATSGNIVVRRSQGDVRAVSLNGDIDIQCVHGRVDVSNARGAIKLAGIGGDVDATTTSSNITYTGAIRDNGRYRLKAVEGEVLMAVPDNSPGFTALLSSYNGAVQTDFQIRDSSSAHSASGADVNHRVEARNGNGQAQITLDSFNQPVRLTRLAAGASTGCQ